MNYIFTKPAATHKTLSRLPVIMWNVIETQRDVDKPNEMWMLNAGVESGPAGREIYCKC